MYEFWTEKKSEKKNPKIFQKKKNFFAFFGSKSWNGGEITNLCQKQNHKIEGITNFEITKCGDPLYCIGIEWINMDASAISFLIRKKQEFADKIKTAKTIHT